MATDALDKGTKKWVRNEIRKVAEPLRDAWAQRIRELHPPSVKTADNYRIVVRRTGVVSVEQRLGKTTGLRPDWGRTQMTYGAVPAAQDTYPEMVGRFEEEMNLIAAEVNAL